MQEIEVGGEYMRELFVIDKKNYMAQEMIFINPEFICAIGNLINCEVNNGNGVVEDESGHILMIDHSEDETVGKTLCLAGFCNEKYFRKYMKNPQKGIKYLKADGCVLN